MFSLAASIRKPRAAVCLHAVSTVLLLANATPVWPQVSADAPGPVTHVTFPSGTPLGQQISALLAHPGANRAHWGIAVTAMDGTPIYGLEEGKLFRPASNTKLFTTAAAMALLGPDHRFSTRIYGDLDQATGIVNGDLTLLGGGDPSFGTNDLPYRPPTQKANTSAAAAATPSPAGAPFAYFAEELTRHGVKRVTGNVVGNATLFAQEAPPQGWAAEDLVWGYGALPSALSVGDNELKLTVRPKPAGRVLGYPDNWIGSFAELDQLVPHIKVVNEVVTEPADGDHKDGVDVETATEPRSVRVFGRLSPGAAPDIEHLSLPDPAAYAAEALQSALAKRNIIMDGKAVQLPGPRSSVPESFLAILRQHRSGCEGMALGDVSNCAYDCLSTPHSEHLLAEFLSPPLAQDIAFTLKTSSNVHAEILLHHLGLKASCPGVSDVEGARMLREYLLSAGLDGDDFLFYDGSGLSAKDLVTPRATAQLLAYAAKQSWFPVWKAALPVGGVDGSLASRFPDPPLKRHVSAKTGTLGESRALSGYLDAASGKTVIFSIMVDNHMPGGSADREVMDRLVAAIAAAN